MAEAVGAPIKQFTKKCFVPMIENLSDKATLVRQDVIASVNKWRDAMGAEVVIVHMTVLLTTENPESRGESLKWILEHTDNIKDADHTPMIKPLISCLSDKKKDIRDQAEKVISHIMPIVRF